jgi:hypothetical protein
MRWSGGIDHKSKIVQHCSTLFKRDSSSRVVQHCSKVVQELVFLLVFIFIPFTGHTAQDTLSQQEIQQMKDKASELGGSVKSYTGRPSSMRENVVNPATGQSQMWTIDKQTSFNGTLQCSNPVEFLKVSVLPDATKGDITSLKVYVNKDLQNNPAYDTVTTITQSPVGVISGVCANGFVSCDPGTWNHCSYFKWKADANFGVSVEQYSSSDIAGLGGCYCFNVSCSPQNYLILNINQILGHLGGGIVGAIHEVRPDVSISGAQIQDNAIVYTASLPTNCSSTQGSAPTSYYNPKNDASLQQAVSNVQANPPSEQSFEGQAYIAVQFQYQQSGFETKVCREQRTITCSCPEGYTYDSNTHRCLAQPSCPEGTYYDNGQCVCKKSGGEGYTCNCPDVFDCGIDPDPYTFCVTMQTEDGTSTNCVTYSSPGDCDKRASSCTSILCFHPVCYYTNRNNENIRAQSPPKCSIKLKKDSHLQVKLDLSHTGTHGGAEWCISNYELSVTGPSYSDSWHKFSSDTGGVRPNQACPFCWDCNCYGGGTVEDHTITAPGDGWYDVTLYYMFDNYWYTTTWKMTVIADFNCPDGGSYDPSFQKCVATPVTTFSETHNCSSIDSDPTCKIFSERVDLGDNQIPSSDDVWTVKNFLSTGVALQPQCKYDCAYSSQLCYPWWFKERTYMCQQEAYDFGKERIKTVVTSAQANSNPQSSTVAYYTDYRQTDLNSNQWVTEQGSIGRADYQVNADSCQKACKVKKNVPNTQVTDTGSTIPQSQTNPQTNEYYYRECTNNTCPYDSSSESVVIQCQCINEFAEAATVFAALNEASKTMICSSGNKVQP